MKSQKEQRRATKSNEKQQKATKSNKKQQRTSELEKPKRARKNQDEQRRAQKVQMETRLKAWFPFGHFLPFVARFGFSYQQKATTSNAMLKWKHPQKTKTSNKKP